MDNLTNKEPGIEDSTVQDSANKEQKKKEWVTCCNVAMHWQPKEVAAHIVSVVLARYVPPYAKLSNRDETSRILKPLYP